MENSLIKINEKNANDFNYSLLVDTSVLLGEIMIKNGAETKQVELAMVKLLHTTKMNHVEVVVTTTNILVTLSNPSFEHITAVRRILQRQTNLNRVNLAYVLLNQYCNNEIDLEELFHELKKVKNSKQYSNYIKVIGAILIPPSFAIMLGGSFMDVIAAFMCSVLLVIWNKLFSFITLNGLIKDCLLILLVTVLAVFLSTTINCNAQTVIVGFIMPYVPGIALTNATRDMFNGDYMSGSARLLDAIVQSFGVAIGVYSGFYLANLLNFIF